MTGPREPIVSAEVLLRRPEAIHQVVRLLEREGVEVTATGAASVSIRCGQSTFERVFQVRLRAADQNVAASEVLDFGPAGGPSLRADGPVQIPAEIAADVEGVYLSQPPRRFW